MSPENQATRIEACGVSPGAPNVVASYSNGGMNSSNIRIAAIGDLHIRTTVPTRLVYQAIDLGQRSDLLIIAGDITNGGRILEVEIAAEFFRRIDIPMLCVLGNHDRRTTRRRHFISVLREAGVKVLDGETTTIPGFPEVGFAGVGGSGGGFWPEEAESSPSNRAMQAMAVRARREAARLDAALTAMNTPV